MSRIEGEALGMRCHCGAWLYGDTESEVWFCNSCDASEDNCECDE